MKKLLYRIEIFASPDGSEFLVEVTDPDGGKLPIVAKAKNLMTALAYCQAIIGADQVERGLRALKNIL